jgi:hypothetical protein
VLLRHFPGLAPALFKLKNPFAPWNLAVQPRADEARPQHARVAPVADAYPPIPVNRSAPEATPAHRRAFMGTTGLEESAR